MVTLKKESKRENKAQLDWQIHGFLNSKLHGMLLYNKIMNYIFHTGSFLIRCRYWARDSGGQSQQHTCCKHHSV